MSISTKLAGLAIVFSRVTGLRQTPDISFRDQAIDLNPTGSGYVAQPVATSGPGTVVGALMVGPNQTGEVSVFQPATDGNCARITILNVADLPQYGGWGRTVAIDATTCL